MSPEELADPLLREALEIPEAVRLTVAAALRVEMGLTRRRRLGPWPAHCIGVALGLSLAERRAACALAGYLARYDGPDRISCYLDMFEAGGVTPDWFDDLLPGEITAIVLHRELDRQLRN